ncbi:MAG: ACP S-malonyltransferase [Planctomycetota bacterium]|nr:ACP S-malonyltransferase [Planctomycetota bacterium]
MGKIAFLFPGQGAQQVGMCREICEALPAARQRMEQANDVLGYDLAQVCFEGPEERLNSTVVSQPALYVSSFLALEKLKEESPDLLDDCQAAAGLSLGEYTAIAFAGGFSFEDGLKLVQKRGEAMQAAADETASGMVSVLGLEREQVAAVCDAARQEGEVLQIANLLCPGNTAVSGHQGSCQQVAAVAEAEGAIKSIPLAVAGAFHTSIMESAVAKLESALAAVDIQPSRIPVYSNVDAQPHTEPEQFRELLVRQVCSPVLWHDSMQQLLDDGFDEFFEVGYGRVLRGLLKRIARRTPCHGVLE